MELLRGCKNCEEHERKRLSCLEQTVSKTSNLEDAAAECSKGSEKCGIGTWRKRVACSGVTESLAKLCPAVMCEAEQISDELVYPAKVSRQNIEGATWFLVAAYCKMLEEKD